MPIDTSVPQSAGWWINRLARDLGHRNQRLERLHRYYIGDPPLPYETAAAKAALQVVHRRARTNFAELIVRAVLDRMRIRAIRTAVDDDQMGDEEAWKIFRYNGLQLGATDVHQLMLSLSVSYVIVGDVDPDPESGGVPLITVEDPREVITEHDPIRPRLIRAALKMYHDDAYHLDVAYLYLLGDQRPNGTYGPVRVFRATRQRTAGRKHQSPTFTAGSWDWDEDKGGADGLEWTKTKKPPIVRFLNRDGKGEFETHTDLLDRINSMILQRCHIATLQAFRQRAIKGLPDEYPEGHELAGQKIDYDELFAADPGALWQLPATAEMWESGQVDLTPILSSVKDDVQHLAAVTRLPLPMFTPDAVTQSAEGASAAREGHVFNVEDKDARAEESWAQVIALAFEVMGDTERAKSHEISLAWAPAERFSLTEKASASVQAATAGVPWETRMASIWQYTPEEIARMKSERSDDQLLAATVAAQQAAALAAATDAQQASGAAAGQ